MHKLESFALSCGSKIEKPFIEKNFYPILDKKYICISSLSDNDSKDYDFFNDVIFHIKPYLEENGISILEIGNNQKKPYFYCKNYRHLSRLQSSYVISKSLLYFGNFNFYSHIANYHDKTVVCVTNQDYADLNKPYNASDKFHVFTPETEDKPLFADRELPKTINLTYPEKVACKILDSLNIKHSLHNVETIHTGEEYYNDVIDIVPGDYYLQNLNISGPVNIRLDKNFNLNFLGQCKILQEINIVTDKLIPMEYIRFLKGNLKMISFFVSKETSALDVKSLQKSGVKLNLLNKNIKDTQEIRMNLIDYQVRNFGTKTKKDLDVKSLKNLKFLSKRNIISEGQVYNSYLSLSRKKNTSSVIDSPEFWEDLPFCRIYKVSKK